MPNLPKLTQDFVRSILDYDAETGGFHWRPRTASMFRADGANGPQKSAAIWNGRYAGTKAGTLAPQGYIKLSIGKGQHYPAHVIAWLWYYGEWRPGEIDHRHGIRDDNRISELRLASKSQNGANKRKQINNASGFPGVHFDKQRGMWRGRITLNRVNYDAGFHKTPEEAAEARAKIADRVHGEFAPDDADRARYFHSRDLKLRPH